MRCTLYSKRLRFVNDYRANLVWLIDFGIFGWVCVSVWGKKTKTEVKEEKITKFIHLYVVYEKVSTHTGCKRKHLFSCMTYHSAKAHGVISSRFSILFECFFFFTATLLLLPFQLLRLLLLHATHIISAGVARFASVIITFSNRILM